MLVGISLTAVALGLTLFLCVLTLMQLFKFIHLNRVVDHDDETMGFWRKVQALGLMVICALLAWASLYSITIIPS